MKMIKPIVNLYKVIDNFDVVLIGFNGVISDGAFIRPETVQALFNLRKYGKKLVMVTNSSQRVSDIAAFLNRNGVPPQIFEAIVSAGEILHYFFKNRSGEYAGLGSAYFQLGDVASSSVFAGLDYHAVSSLNQADFLYMGNALLGEMIENYLPQLEHAASLNIPLVCAGNDTSAFIDGQIAVAPGAVAEQYAVLGGRILTVGKPDVRILNYALDGLNIEKERILLIGDSIPADIKGANLLGIPAMLVSKGVHVNYIGEGYIPDVTKTREISTNFDAYPDFVISELRW